MASILRRASIREELRQLATLIAEAGAVQDTPGEDTIQLSRFQAGLWVVARPAPGRHAA